MIAAPDSFSVHGYLLPGKERFKAKGFIEFVSMLAMAVPGTVLVSIYQGYANGLCWDRRHEAAFTAPCNSDYRFIVRPSTGTRSGIFSPCAR